MWLRRTSRRAIEVNRLYLILAARSRAVFQLRFPGSTRTMSAAEDLSLGFHSMSEDPTMTVRTDWRERMNCTFEAIERVMLARYDDFKCFVVFVFANFAFGHPTNPSRAAAVSAVSGLFCR